MVGDFDKAILKKVQKVWPNTIYANTAVTYNAVYSGGNSPVEGELRFPLINIYRPDGYELLPIQTLPGRLQGYTMEQEEDEQLYQGRFLFAKLAYQFNIFAKTLEELDHITNDILTMFSLAPTLEVTQKSLDNSIIHEETYDITYLRGPTEQSTFDSGDRIYTYAIAYEIASAKLLNFRKVSKVTDVEVKVKVEGTQEEDYTLIPEK